MSAEPGPDEIPEAVPAGEPARPGRVCSHCGGTDIARGLPLGQQGDVGPIGPTFRIASVLAGAVSLLGHERLHVDLCEACGTVVRLYVKETEKDWAVPANRTGRKRKKRKKDGE